MEILITYGHREEDLASLPIRDLALFVLEREGKPINTEVSISFVDDTAMAELNERFRGMEGPTDVLSFECDNIDDDITAADGPSCPVYELGDIIVVRFFSPFCDKLRLLWYNKKVSNQDRKDVSMQLFELVSPRLFRPLAGPNRAFYAELLLLLWEECRHTADYSISRAEAVSRAEDYFAALAKPLALDADGAGDEDEQPTRDPHTLAVGFLLRLRRTGWLEETPGSYEGEASLAFVPEVAPLLEALEEILNPRVVTYTGKLYKAWQLLGGIGQEKSPYENVLREVDSDLDALNRSLRALNASIGHYIDRLTRNRTPQEVLELFDQYEEKVVAAAYHRFKTSDNLFNYRAYLEEELDDCEAEHLPRLALDYARVERCAPGEAAPAVRALIQKLRDSLEEMSTLMRQIDQSHIRYRKRAVQRAQFLLLSDRSSQGSVTALLRRYAEEIKTPDQLFAPDDGPVAKHLHLYPAAVFGAKPLYPPAAPRSETPLAPVRQAGLDEEQLRKEQQLLLDYARMAVTEENVGLLAKQALAARSAVAASTLAEEYPRDFARIIGLHTYSQSPRRAYDITLTGNWVERGGFRFEEFILTPRREDADHGRTE